MKNIEVNKLHTLLGHKESIYTLEHLDQNRFLSSGGDGMVVAWDMHNPDEGEVIAKVEGSVYAIRYDPDEGYLYVGENNQGIHKIDLQAKKEETSIHLGDVQIFDMQWVKNYLWAGLSSGELVILTKNLEVVHRQKIASDRIRRIDPHGKEVAIACSDNFIRIVDTQSLAVKKELSGHKNSVFVSRYHPSGKYILSAGRDAHVKVWDTQENYLLRESIAAHLYTINDAVFSTDGRYFFTGSMDKAIKLWDAHNFRLLKVLDKHRHAGHGNSVNKLLWMDSDHLLVTCSDDRSISIWKVNFAE